MTRYNRKEKVSENIQTNFNQSKEIAYWANKYNLSIERFQQLFNEAGNSISNLLRSGTLKNSIAA